LFASTFTQEDTQRATSRVPILYKQLLVGGCNSEFD